MLSHFFFFIFITILVIIPLVSRSVPSSAASCRPTWSISHLRFGGVGLRGVESNGVQVGASSTFQGHLILYGTFRLQRFITLKSPDFIDLTRIG